MRYSHQICGRYQRGAEILGKRWMVLIINQLMEQPIRFGELSSQLEVVGDRMLSERLKELEQEGLVERRVYDETPVRIEYGLTDKGKALGPVIDALHTWSETWMDIPAELAEE